MDLFVIFLDSPHRCLINLSQSYLLDSHTFLHAMLLAGIRLAIYVQKCRTLVFIKHSVQLNLCRFAYVWNHIPSPENLQQISSQYPANFRKFRANFEPISRFLYIIRAFQKLNLQKYLTKVLETLQIFIINFLPTNYWHVSLQILDAPPIPLIYMGVSFKLRFTLLL